MRQLRFLICGLLILALLPVSAQAVYSSPEIAGRVTAVSLNMRQLASTSAPVQTIAREGDTLTVLSSLSSEGMAWYKVYHRGKTGYMSAEHVELLSNTDMLASIIETPAPSVAPLAPPATLRVGTVTASSLRLRKSASTSAPIVMTLSKNIQLTILSPETIEADGYHWLKVNFEGKEGYISAEYVSLNDSGSFSAGTGMITGGTVNLRSEPNVESVIVRKLTDETNVKVVGVENGWYKVSYNNKDGYVHPDYLKIIPPPAPKPASSSSSSSSSASSASSSGGTAYGSTKTSTKQDLAVGQAALEKAGPSSAERKVVETALKYLGSRYVYGASNGKTFDCSGYTSWVMKEIGRPINRSATDQYINNGSTVSKSDLRPGDLVFFSDKSISRKIVSHVGIYIGNGYFVHAGSGSNGSGKCVKVDSISSGHYSRIYKGAKRVI